MSFDSRTSGAENSDEHLAFVEELHFKRLAKHHVGPGDLVVAGLVDPLVRCCELPQNIGPALVKADCYRYKVASSHHHGMTLVRIGLRNFRRIPSPLPPLAEQHRIVAKVDELMAVCDKLEAQISASENERTGLLEATLHQALAVA